jgi:hypothetical protein
MSISRGSFEVVVMSGPPSSSELARTRLICLSRAPRHDRKLLERCTRLRGRIVWIRHVQEPDGGADVHFLVLAHFHLYIVKVHPPYPRDLSRGRPVTAIGPLVEPHPSRLGIDEVEAFYLSREPLSAARALSG